MELLKIEKENMKLNNDIFHQVLNYIPLGNTLLSCKHLSTHIHEKVNQRIISANNVVRVKDAKRFMDLVAEVSEDFLDSSIDGSVESVNELIENNMSTLYEEIGTDSQQESNSTIPFNNLYFSFHDVVKIDIGFDATLLSETSFAFEGKLYSSGKFCQVFNNIFAAITGLNSDKISSSDTIEVERNHYLIYYDSINKEPSSWFDNQDDITSVVHLIKQKKRKRKDGPNQISANTGKNKN